MIGLALAALLVHLIGTGPWQLALLVVVAMSVAVLFNGSDLVVSEAAVSAMLLLMIGGTNAPNRILEAIIGGIVALAVAVLFPPKAILHVGRAGQSVMAALGQSLERVASALAAADADRAEAALTQARAIDPLLDALDDALETGRETVRTAPRASASASRWSATGGPSSRSTWPSATRASSPATPIGPCGPGRRRPASPPAVTDLARAVWDLAAAFDEPERAPLAREHAARAAAGAATDALGESIRSTAVDLMRAAELVAGAPEELLTEEILLRFPGRRRPGRRRAGARGGCARSAARRSGRGRAGAPAGRRGRTSCRARGRHAQHGDRVAAVVDQQVRADHRREPAQRLEPRALLR